MKAISANPLARGILPRVGKGRVRSPLYPSEDAALMVPPNPARAAGPVPVLAREGLRVSEATEDPAKDGCDGLTWADFDFERGGIRLDRNKTDAQHVGARSAAALRETWVADRTGHTSTMINGTGGLQGPFQSSGRVI